MNIQQHFGTTNLYKILEIDTNAQISEVKRSYYRLALIHHPDRVPDNEKPIAKEKFSILHQAYVVLSDVQKRQAYDNGNESSFLFAKATRSAEWECFIKPATNDDIKNARDQYQNSFEEQCDIQREYLAGKGSMTYMLNNIPFMRVEDQPRIISIINQLIDEGKIPKQKTKKILKK